MAKYIKCDCCGKRINFGEDVYRINGNAPLYCSADCFADANGVVEYLNDELAEDCWCKVYDDEARITEIRKEMEEHREAMEKLYNELQTLTTQN